jgi:hypothetical protein
VLNACLASAMQHLYMMTPHEMNRNHWDNMLWPMHELSLAELVAVFGHLADLGYAATSREDNPMVRQGSRQS